MEMYREYFEEEYGRKTFSNEFGFCSYHIEGSELFIADFYVKPEFRKTLEAKKLFSSIVNIAEMAGCEFISANVHVEPIKSEKATRLLRTYLAMGFMAFKATNEHVTLAYELNNKEGE
jgi:GNAT superfamily N-acetyltransferase